MGVAPRSPVQSTKVASLSSSWIARILNPVSRLGTTLYALLPKSLLQLSCLKPGRMDSVTSWHWPRQQHWRELGGREMRSGI